MKLPNNTTIKYGVVALDNLVADLREWQTFYMAGRFQKPMMVVRDDALVRLANRNNLLNAVRVSLLMLPLEFSEEDLFLTIAGLSYQGFALFDLMIVNIFDFRRF